MRVEVTGGPPVRTEVRPMPRTLAVIDHAITIEWKVWLIESRAGRSCAAAVTAMRRIDSLLEERTATARAHAPAP